MGISVDSEFRALANDISLNELLPEEPPAVSPLGAVTRILEQTSGALSSWARGPGPLGPYIGPPADVTNIVPAMNTDSALSELQAAQQEMVEANGSGNFRRVDEALTSLMEAQGKFKQAIQAEGGAASVLARHPNDPATKTAVSAAELAIAQDRLTQAEGKIPDLKDIPAQEEESRIQPELYRELADARRDVGIKTDALEHDVNAQALRMRDDGMSREEALSQLRAQGYSHVFGTASDQLENGKMPNTIGMNQNELMGVYVTNFQSNASPEAIDAFNRGEAVIFAIRHDTPLQANAERGAYDDRYVVLQRTPSGMVQMKEFDGSQDPNTQYGDGMRDDHFLPADKAPGEVGPYADIGDFGMSAAFNFVTAYSRVADGTIKMQTGPKPDHLYPENGDYMIQGDVNGDGVFNDDYFRAANTNAFQLHAGKQDYSHTGSGGCLTLPPHQWDAFKEATGVFGGGPMSSIYYVQVGESKLQY